MGVDILGIVKHNLDSEEILKLPSKIDLWDDVKNAKQSSTYQHQEFLTKNLRKKTKWFCDNEMTVDALEAIWKAYKKDNVISEVFRGFDNQIDSFFGDLKIYQNVVIISHSPEHKYGNINMTEPGTRIVKANRLIAKHFNANEILYFPDSAYPTSTIEEFAMEGDKYDEIKRKSIELFGKPPKGINEGRKYMFFFDDINDELGPITNRENWEGYWKYNELMGEYEFDKTYGM